MPSYTVHYSNSAGSPPVGDPVAVDAVGVDAVIRFAQHNLPDISHQASVGDVRGFTICDSHGTTVVPWQEHDA